MTNSVIILLTLLGQGDNGYLLSYLLYLIVMPFYNIIDLFVLYHF